MTTFEPRYGEAVTVSDDVVRVTANNPGPFTGAGTNTYLLGTRCLMVVDPGPDDPAHVAALAAAVAGRPVSHILVTHTHRDHVGGLAALRARTGGTTVGEGPHREARPLKPGEANPFLRAADLTFAPDRAVAHETVVANDEVTVRAIATPGHTANHVAFAFGDLLFSGDHVMGWSTTVVAPPDGRMRDYLTSLDALLNERFRAYLPGHGGAVEEPQRAVSAMRSHRLMREAAILDRVRAGDTTIAAIVDALYAGIDERLRGAAAMSVLAHLEKLEEDGTVRSVGYGRDATWTPQR